MGHDTGTRGSYDSRVGTIDTTGNYCQSIVPAVLVTQGATSSTGGGGSHPIGVSAPVLPTASVIEIGSLNGTLRVEVPQAPYIASCTPSYVLGTVVTRSVKLCAGQTYRPFKMVGNNIAIVGDVGGTAKIQSVGRTYGITIPGSGVLVSGVKIVGATAAQDLATGCASMSSA